MEIPRVEADPFANYSDASEDVGNLEPHPDDASTAVLGEGEGDVAPLADVGDERLCSQQLFSSLLFDLFAFLEYHPTIIKLACNVVKT